MAHYTVRYQPGNQTLSPQYTPFVEQLEALLGETQPIGTEAHYNLFLGQVDGLIQKHLGIFTLPTPVFDAEMKAITANPTLAFPDPMISSTPWGAVVHKFIDVDGTHEKSPERRVRKELVIKQRGILGFEIHKKKDEFLEVLDGVVVFIHSIHADKVWKQGQVSLTVAEKGATIHFLPGDEHGMIALSNTVVEEQSTYDLTDLIFLYNSIQVI